MADDREPVRTSRIKGEEEARPAASYESGTDPEDLDYLNAKVKLASKRKQGSDASRLPPLPPSYSSLPPFPSVQSPLPPSFRSPKRPRLSEKKTEAQPSLGETLKFETQLEEMGEKLKSDNARLTTLQKEVEGLRRSLEDLKRKVEDRSIVFNIRNGI
ncbi:hypothetical protein IL306_014621 [Fusarium sp. DS 682]|nr:hypothetical protein IL306_014621 [Fusarium sp. DS 682]